MNTRKNIIREIPPERADYQSYFDDDGFSEAAGDFCYTLFIIPCDRRRYSGYHMDEYEKLEGVIESISEGFAELENGAEYWQGYKNRKEIMEAFDFKFNPSKCHALKELIKNIGGRIEPDDVAAFLTIKTGKRWDVTGVYGYCQGDYVDVVYCPEHHNGAKEYGEVWLGCAREFMTIEYDDDGKEWRCGGYIVADCLVKDDSDYKRLVCDWTGLDEDETELELFDGYVTSASWRTA